jgi:uncharacterized membrane protein
MRQLRNGNPKADADAPGKSEEDRDQNIKSVIRLETKALRRRTLAERVADRVTLAVGSTVCILAHLVWFGLWIAINEGAFSPRIKPFDPFPFSLLTLIVSLEAIFMTQLVLMTQNRMQREADKRAHLDLQVNLLAEQEGTMTIRMLCRICEHLGLEVDDPHVIEKLKESTNVGKLAQRLEKHLPGG